MEFLHLVDGMIGMDEYDPSPAEKERIARLMRDATARTGDDADPSSLYVPHPD